MGRRGRGGAVQRLSTRQPPQQQPGTSDNQWLPSLTPRSTSIGNQLVDLCAWKYISPQMLQDLANKCLEDIIYVVSALTPEETLKKHSGAEIAQQLLPGLTRLAKLGSYGEYPNNINRDLLTALPPVFKV